MNILRCLMTLFCASTAAAAAPAATPISTAEARQSLVGRWQGKLEYRDYQADRWFGLPLQVEVRDGGDGATLIRTADYDDGPKTGIVRITSVTLLGPDGAEETGATFRKGRPVELSRAKLSLDAKSVSAEDWIMIETVSGSDDDRPATLRTTTTRRGKSLVTLKEVDFGDDAKIEWVVRNRTTLERR